MPTVIVPIATKKMTPKLTIPVYPVCRLRENDIKMNMESVISTFETCNTFFHLKSSDSAIGNQIRKRRRMVMNIENAIQEPKELSLPYISNFLR